MTSFKNALDILKGKNGYYPVSDKEADKGFIKIADKKK